jgi:GT2 family glycosyltransferase
MKVGYVCTSYNNSSVTRAAIASLHAGGRAGDVRVVVVDNRSRDADVASLGAVAREFPGVELLLNPENVGYFAGLNLGIGRLRTLWPDIEHVVIGNNDLVFPADFVDIVERHCEVFERWAVVAPDLLTPDGVHQNPHVFHPIGRVRKLIWDLYYINYAGAVMIKGAARLTRWLTGREENAHDGELYKIPGPIEQGYGACYLLGPLFFRKFARLYAPTFMMQEEFFLYEQLKTIGQMTYYDPRFVVHHTGHATMDMLPNARQWTLARDAHRVYKRYLALPAAARRRLIATGAGEPA